MVVVVGAGVVGLCVAESLARRGAEVVVLDAGRAGEGVSAGNAGWVCPGIAVPVPAPGMTAQALRWMLNPRSPLLVRPRLQGSYLKWLLDFHKSTSSRCFGAGAAALATFARRVIGDFDALRDRCDFEMHDDGLLFVGRSEASLAAELRLLRQQQNLGYAGKVTMLDREEALAHEPQLWADVPGAVLAAAERHVRPETLIAGLVDRLSSLEVPLRWQTTVSRLRPAGGGWTIECGDGSAVEAESVVVAAGVPSAELLAPLDVNLPLQSAKGYSLTRDDRGDLRGPIYLLDAKVAVSPYQGALRAAGTLELGSRGSRVSSVRTAAIERAVHRALPGLERRAWQTWAGDRSLFPDGLPAIGPVAGQRGLHVAVGHAMLGVTLAPTTGEVLAPVVLGERSTPTLAAFGVDRFG